MSKNWMNKEVDRNKIAYREGYNKAIDDFAEACKQNIMCQTFGLHPRNVLHSDHNDYLHNH